MASHCITADTPSAVAHVRHPATGLWWQYDDERVLPLGAHPLGDAAAAKASTPAKPKAGAKGRGKAGGDDDVVVVEDSPVAPRGRPRGAQAAPPAAAAPAASGVPEGHLASSDAYLLLYTRRPAPGEAPHAEPALPDDLAAAIAKENEDAAAGARAREEAARGVRERVAARQNEVRQVLALAEPRPGDDADLRWISADWLTKWSSTEYAPSFLGALAVCVMS